MNVKSERRSEAKKSSNAYEALAHQVRMEMFDLVKPLLRGDQRTSNQGLVKLYDSGLRGRMAVEEYLLFVYCFCPNGRVAVKLRNFFSPTLYRILTGTRPEFA